MVRKWTSRSLLSSLHHLMLVDGSHDVVSSWLWVILSEGKEWRTGGGRKAGNLEDQRVSHWNGEPRCDWTDLLLVPTH
jgi:hypothetical protein